MVAADSASAIGAWARLAIAFLLPMLLGHFTICPRAFAWRLSARTLGPSGGWFIKDKVVGKVPLHLGCTPQGAEVENGKVHLTVQVSRTAAEREILTEHIIAATGYRVDLKRLKFLRSGDSLASSRSVGGAPVLSSSFESSVPGLYFVGSCGRKQLWAGHAVCVRSWLCSSHVSPRLWRRRSSTSPASVSVR